MKHYLYLLLLATVTSCRPSASYRSNEGFVFGTTYHITYSHTSDLHQAITERFNDYDQSLSTYNPQSLISRINRNETDQTDSLMARVIQKAFEVNRLSQGAFDITIAPLANAWGFGFAKADSITPNLIDSLKQITGMHHLKWAHNRLTKDDPRVMLETSALAEGFGVDVIGMLLESHGIHHYMVEVGGEVRARGQNAKGTPWRIGIDKPIDDPTAQQREIQEIVHITHGAVSTSGNYRKFYLKDGKKYAHIIDPHTGYPVSHNLLSVTVIAPDCITSDALSTAFMVLGLEKALPLAETMDDIEVYFIYTDSLGVMQTTMTSGFEKLLQPKS